MIDRIKFLESYVNLESSTILELGALDKPVTPPNKYNSFYVDCMSYSELKEKYKDDETIDISSIVNINYVWNNGNLSDSITDDRSFNIIIASHVFEHLPNPVQWLIDARKILSPNGMIFLALPDRRFTFDWNRKDTQLSDWIGWYLRKIERPSVDQVFDFLANVSRVPDNIGWNDPRDNNLGLVYNTDYALELACLAFDESNYIDSHCSVFTPYQFIELCKGLSSVGLFPYYIEAFQPTEFLEHEFIVLLRAFEAEPLSPIDNAKLQELARTAGYVDAFGGGKFMQALEADAGLRQKYEALVNELRSAMQEQRSLEIARSFPEVDRELHHQQPRVDDPRRQKDIRTATDGLGQRKWWRRCLWRRH